MQPQQEYATSPEHTALPRYGLSHLAAWNEDPALHNQRKRIEHNNPYRKVD